MANEHLRVPQGTSTAPPADATYAGHGRAAESERGTHSAVNTAGTEAAPNQINGKFGRHEIAHGVGGISHITGKAMEGTAGIVGNSLHAVGLKGLGKMSKDIGKNTGDLTSSMFIFCIWV